MALTVSSSKTQALSSGARSTLTSRIGWVPCASGSNPTRDLFAGAIGLIVRQFVVIDEQRPVDDESKPARQPRPFGGLQAEGDVIEPQIVCGERVVSVARREQKALHCFGRRASFNHAGRRR